MALVHSALSAARIAVRAVGQRAVVEGQHDLFRIEEVVGLVVLEAEARSARGVDLDDARDAERIGIARALRRLGRRRSRAHRRLLLRGRLLGESAGVERERAAEHRAGDEGRRQNCAH